MLDATANCENLSSLLDSFLPIRIVGSKPFTSAAIFVSYASGSKHDIVSIP